MAGGTTRREPSRGADHPTRPILLHRRAPRHNLGVRSSRRTAAGDARPRRWAVYEVVRDDGTVPNRSTSMKRAGSGRDLPALATRRYRSGRPPAKHLRREPHPDQRASPSCRLRHDAGEWTVRSEVAQGPAKLGRSSGRWAPLTLLAAAAMWGGAGAVISDGLRTRHHRHQAVVASRGLNETYAVGEVDQGQDQQDSS